MTTNRCIKNLLKLIALLQNNSQEECCDVSCTKPFLGPALDMVCYNTRVITLYNKNGTQFTSTYTDSNNNIQASGFFRIQSVDDNCVTCLILNKVGNSYVSTTSYITINLSCICAIKCIEDTVVENL